MFLKVNQIHKVSEFSVVPSSQERLPKLLWINMIKHQKHKIDIKNFIINMLVALRPLVSIVNRYFSPGTPRVFCRYFVGRLFRFI